MDPNTVPGQVSAPAQIPSQVADIPSVYQPTQVNLNAAGPQHRSSLASEASGLAPARSGYAGQAVTAPEGVFYDPYPTAAPNQVITNDPWKADFSGGVRGVNQANQVNQGMPFWVYSK